MREPFASDREYIEAQREHHAHVTQANANVPQQASGDCGSAQKQQPSKEEGNGYPPIGTGRHHEFISGGLDLIMAQQLLLAVSNIRPLTTVI